MRSLPLGEEGLRRYRSHPEVCEVFSIPVPVFSAVATPLPISALLLAHEAPDFRGLQGRWVSLPPLKDPGGGRHRYVVLGRFDELILTVSAELDDLIHSGTSIAANARAATASSYIGRVVAPGDGFEPSRWAETHPILGFCSVRFGRRVLAAGGSFEFLDRYLTEKLAVIGEVRHVIISATSWEDVIVLFYAKNFNAVARAAGVLRGMRIDDLPLAAEVDATDQFTHPCLTTCTLPAYCCDWHEGWTRQDTEAVLQRLDAEAPLNWAVRLELHPGHWQGFQKHMLARCEELGLKVHCRPTFGQTDLRIADDGSAASATHRALLTFLMEVIYPLAAEDRSVIRSAETHLHPVFPEAPSLYAEDGAGSMHTDQTYKRPNQALTVPTDVRSKLTDLAVPPHTLRVLEETLSRVQGMSHDPMHGEEFETLKRLQGAFFRAVRNLQHQPSIAEEERQSRELQRDISDWQMNLDRCLADRYRGAYPTGDSLMMRLGSYQGAHHRFLVIMDHLAQQSYDMARRAMQEVMSHCLLPNVALATFIGNSPSAYATSHTVERLGCGFTDVPATLVCRLRDSHLLAHETGHHVVRAFFCAHPSLGFTVYDKSSLETGLGEAALQRLAEAGLPQTLRDRMDRHWGNPAFRREVRELLADYFARQICFPNNGTRHEEANQRTLEHFYKNGHKRFKNSVQVEFRIRSAGLKYLDAPDAAEGLRCYQKEIDQGMSLIQAKGGDTETLKRVCDHSERVRAAVETLRALKHLPEIHALLEGIHACGQHQHFPTEEAEAPSLLADMRDFMARPGPVTLEQNFEFLDHLWFKHLRHREHRHLIPTSLG